MYMYTKHLSLLIETIIKSSCQRHKVLCLQFKKGVFRRILSVVFVMCHFLKLQSMLLSKFQSFLVTAVTIQTSGASRDFALYSLEVLRGRQIYHLYFITPINAVAFIRTCAKVLP